MIQVTLEIAEAIEQDARSIAQQTQHELPAVLQEWLERYAAQIPVDTLSDERVLALSQMQINSCSMELSALS